jgi:hypothetical protein
MFHVEMNGVNVTGTLTIPHTAGWQNWTAVTKTGVALPAGTQRLRVVIDSSVSSSVANFYWLRLSGG